MQLSSPFMRFHDLAPPGGPGLACDDDGVTLGPVTLVAVEDPGDVGVERTYRLLPFTPVAEAFAAAYGPIPEAELRRRYRNLVAVTRCLNDGDLAKATMTALLMRLPEIEPDGMAKLALTRMAKYNPAELRVPKGNPTGGQWTSGATPGAAAGDTAPGASASAKPSRTAPPRDATRLTAAGTDEAVPTNAGSVTPVSFTSTTGHAGPNATAPARPAAGRAASGRLANDSRRARTHPPIAYDQVAAIVYNETANLSGDGLFDARVQMAEAIYNGDYLLGARRPKTADDVLPSNYSRSVLSEVKDAVDAAAIHILSNADTTNGAIHFHMRTTPEFNYWGNEPPSWGPTLQFQSRHGPFTGSKYRYIYIWRDPARHL